MSTLIVLVHSRTLWLLISGFQFLLYTTFFFCTSYGRCTPIFHFLSSLINWSLFCHTSVPFCMCTPLITRSHVATRNMRDYPRLSIIIGGVMYRRPPWSSFRSANRSHASFRGRTDDSWCTSWVWVWYGCEGTEEIMKALRWSQWVGAELLLPKYWTFVCSFFEDADYERSPGDMWQAFVASMGPNVPSIWKMFFPAPVNMNRSSTWRFGYIGQVKWTSIGVCAVATGAFFWFT